MGHKKLNIRRVSSGDYNTFFNLFAEGQRIHAKELPEFFRMPSKNQQCRTFFDNILQSETDHLALGYIGEDCIGLVQYFLGHQSATFHKPKRSFGYISLLFVLEDYRRLGYGSELIEFVKEHALRLGIRSVGLDFWSFNEPARCCFEASGFRTKQEIMWLDF